LRNVLNLVVRVFALKELLRDSMPCFETGFFTKGSAGLLNDAMKAALVELRPHMISLVEYKQSVDNWYCDLSGIGN
jgi:hypothetical protein